MKNYSEYELVDFLFDDSFINWTTTKSLNKDDFWAEWPHKYPERAEIYYQAVEVASGLTIRTTDELSKFEVLQLVDDITKKTQAVEVITPPKTRKLQWLKIAASILLVCTAGIIWYSKIGVSKTSAPTSSNKNASFIKIDVPGVIRLPDNSTVILKPGGKLSYSKFDGKLREVYLDGEAFFEVTKNPLQPFLVHTAGLITKVLGTSFAIKAYNHDKEFNITVSTGRVSVFPQSKSSDYTVSSKTLEKTSKNGVLLTPNQEVTFYRNETKLVVRKLDKPVNLSKEVTEVKFNFVDTPFAEVIATLSKAYGIKIIYNEKKMGNCPLTASLSTQHLYQKLDLICQAVEASYKIEDGEILIEGKGCNEKIN